VLRNFSYLVFSVLNISMTDVLHIVYAKGVRYSTFSHPVWLLVQTYMSGRN